MPSKHYNVQGPDGQQHVIEGPDNATDDEVIAQAKLLFGGSAPAAAPKEDKNAERLAQAKKYRTAEETTGAAAVNPTTGMPTPSSQPGKGIEDPYPRVNRAMTTMWGDMDQTANLVRHPLDTLNNAAEAGHIARLKILRGQPDTSPGLIESVAGPTVERIKAGQYPEAIGGIGAGVLTSLIPGAAEEAAGGVLGAAKGALQKSRVALAGGETRYAEQQLAGGLKPGKEQGALIERIAPDVAENPELVKLKSARFDQRVFQDFKVADAKLKAAEASLPSTATVPKQNILKTLDDKISELQVPDAAGTPMSGHPDAVKALTEARAKIDAFQDHIPLKNILEYRRQLDDAIQTAGGWKETTASADKAVMEAKRDVANAIRHEIGNTSAALKEANEAFSRAADSMKAADLNWQTGRRMSTVAAPTAAQKVLKGAGKIAVPAAVGTLGYEVYKNRP